MDYNQIKEILEESPIVSIILNTDFGKDFLTTLKDAKERQVPYEVLLEEEQPNGQNFQEVFNSTLDAYLLENYTKKYSFNL